MSTPFHADLSIAAAAAVSAQGTLLFDPNGQPWLVTRLTISTDTAMRIAVGSADNVGQRIRAGWLGANGGMAPDVCVNGSGKIYVFQGAQGNIEVSIDGTVG